MGTKITFSNISADYASADFLNGLFDLVETEFDKCVYRDGTAPNTMSVDFDLNGNDLLNVGTGNFDDVVVDGVSLATNVANAATSATNSATAAAASAASAAAAAASALAAAVNETFLGLTDTPATYSGQSGKLVAVNVGETGLEFTTSSGSEPSDGDKGDITVSSSGTVWTIDDSIAVSSWNLTTPTITTNFTFDGVTVTGLTGADVSVVTGTAGSNGVLGSWNGDGDLVSSGYTVIDEDDLVSDLNTAVPTQQSVKAYVDTEIAGISSGDTFGTALLHLQDQQAAGSDGGTFTSGAWRTRTLNTEVTDEIGSTLSTNTFTLPAGTYWIEAEAPGIDCGNHKCALYNSTDAAYTLYGTSSRSGDSNTAMNSVLRGRFTIAGAKTFELRHQCTVTKATFGFGVATDIGVTEIYSDVRVWKVA